MKLNQNPENFIGVMSQAGNRVELHISNSNEIGEVLAAIGKIPIRKFTKFISASLDASLCHSTQIALN